LRFCRVDLYTESFAASRAEPQPTRARPPRGGLPFEAHIPTEQPQAQQDARIPRPHAHPRRTRSAPFAPGARPEASRRLIWRIRDRASFEALARARRRKAGVVTLRFVHDGSERPARVSYAVGQWVGPAVERNRTRRRLRAAVGRSEGELMRGGVYLFGAEHGAAEEPFDVLVSAVATLAREAQEHMR
jgi:ribonuclease P protein component